MNKGSRAQRNKAKTRKRSERGIRGERRRREKYTKTGLTVGKDTGKKKSTNDRKKVIFGKQRLYVEISQQGSYYITSQTVRLDNRVIAKMKTRNVIKSLESAELSVKMTTLLAELVPLKVGVNIEEQHGHNSCACGFARAPRQVRSVSSARHVAIHHVLTPRLSKSAACSVALSFQLCCFNYPSRVSIKVRTNT